MRKGVEALPRIAPAVTLQLLRGRPQRVRSPFVAAAMCEAFRAAGTRDEKITRYLQETHEADGSWCFDPHGHRWPPDADDTACALAALAGLGEATSTAILDRIVDEQPGSDGLIRPWLVWHPGAGERLDGNAPDSIVTANVLYAATRTGHDGGSLLGVLEDHVRDRGLEGLTTVYYDSLPIRSYYLARALMPLSLHGPTLQLVRRFLADLEPNGLNVVDAAAALAAAALLGVEAAVRRLLETVVATQRWNGKWPKAKWFVSPPGGVWRSSAFSTALGVEALALVRGT